jgi:hypothetical protein
MFTPGVEKLGTLADFTIPMAGDSIAGTVAVDTAVTTSPDGAVPVAVPVLVTLPALTSA